MPILDIRQGLHAGEKRIVGGSRTIIGRNSDCGVILLDEDIDPAHASIEARGDQWVLQDLGAPGGTWVNEKEVAAPHRLFDGDAIRLNNVLMEFKEDKEQAMSSQNSDYSSGTNSSEGARKKEKRSKIWLEIVVALILILAAATFMLGDDQAIIQFLRDQNEAPGLRSLTDDLAITVSPGQTVYFLTEAQDEKGLERVEFRVNGALVDSRQAPGDKSTKMQTMHQWSSDEAGEYELKVIAYDKVGKRSKSVIMIVTVESN